MTTLRQNSSPTLKTPAMDSSTVIFVIVLIIAFVFLRWFIDSDDELDSRDNNTTNSTSSRSNRNATRQQGHHRREVTVDMIEVVQSIAPHLTVSQIKLDLEQTGSVQGTVDRILGGVELPFPAGEDASTSGADNNDQGGDIRNRTNNIKAENLLEKFKVDEKAVKDVKKNEWSNDSDERHKTLEQKKAEMILRARKRLEKQLKNEQDLSGLQEQ